MRPWPLVSVGLVLLSVGSGEPGELFTSVWFAVALWVGVVALLLAARVGVHWPGSVIAILAGLGYTGSAVAVRGAESATDVVGIAAGLTVGIYGLIGFWLYSVALDRAPVSAASAPLIVTQTFVPSLIGVAFLGDGVRPGWWPGIVVGLVLSTAGAIVLSGDGIASPVNQGRRGAGRLTAMASPTADVSVRVAWADDAAAVATLQARAWQATYAGLLPAEALALDPAATAQAWAAALRSPGDARNRVLVALERNRVVGFAVVSPAADPDCDPVSDAELQELLVDPDERGQGHGSRLLQAVVDTLRADRFTRAVIWTVADADDLRRFLTDAGWGRRLGPPRARPRRHRRDDGQAGPAAHRALAAPGTGRAVCSTPAGT